MQYLLFYIYIRVSSFPELVGVARVNQQRTTDVTRVLKARGAELCQYIDIYYIYYIYIYPNSTLHFLINLTLNKR